MKPALKGQWLVCSWQKRVGGGRLGLFYFISLLCIIIIIIIIFLSFFSSFYCYYYYYFFFFFFFLGGGGRWGSHISEGCGFAVHMPLDKAFCLQLSLNPGVVYMGTLQVFINSNGLSAGRLHQG